MQMSHLETLLQRHPIWRGQALSSVSPTVSTGYAELDRQLPGSGWPTAALTEVLGLQEGIGELQLVLPALARLSTAGKRVVWLAPPHLPYAPALAAAGGDLAHPPALPPARRRRPRRRRRRGRPAPAPRRATPRPARCLVGGGAGAASRSMPCPGRMVPSCPV